VVREPSAGDLAIVLYECPVCWSDGLALGERVDEGQPDADMVHWHPDIKTVVTMFECKVCGPDLADEAAAAGIPTKVTNPHATQDDVWGKINPLEPF